MVETSALDFSCGELRHRSSALSGTERMYD